LLAGLFFIGAGVLVKQSYYDIVDYGINADAVGIPGERQEQDRTVEFSAALPELLGFQSLSEMKVYNSESLYEKINGKAPFYLDSGFKNLSTRRFVSEQNNKLGMEVYFYDMGSHRKAFSVYSRQRRGGAKFLSDMRFGYKTSNAVYFVAGEFYIEIVGTSESTSLMKDMITLSKDVYASLNGAGGDGLSELSLFPGENLVAHSFEFYVADAFGFSGLNNTFTAEYEIDGESLTAFFSKRASSKEAKQVLEAYSKFLVSTGGSYKEIQNQELKEADCKTIDVYGAFEVIFVKGLFVAGVHDALKLTPAQKLSLKLMDSLSKQPSVAKSKDATENE